MEAEVRCVVVDRSFAFARGLKEVLQEEQIATAIEQVDSAAALGAYFARQPATLVIASQEPFPEAFKAATAQADVSALIITSFASSQDMLNAQRAGIKGVIRKDATIKQMTRAIRHVVNGGMAYGEGWGGFGHVPPPNDDSTDSTELALTFREQEVVRLVLAGCSNRRAARQLGVAEQTAKNHLHSAMVKLGVGSRIQLYRWALEHESGRL